MPSATTPVIARRRYSESNAPATAPNTPSTGRRGSNAGIDLYFKRRSSSVRVRKPSYNYLVVKPRTQDDGIASGKVYKMVLLLLLLLLMMCL